MEILIKIRNARPSDWSRIAEIEALNFSEEEAASPHALKERLELLTDTFLVAEQDGQILAYIVGPAILSRHLTDNLFDKVAANPKEGGFIAVQSLSVHPDFQQQGIGSLLLAGLKEKAKIQNRQGISLTCHDYLISYYEMNDFLNEGRSDSAHAGAVWYDMVWENPYFR